MKGKKILVAGIILLALVIVFLGKGNKQTKPQPLGKSVPARAPKKDMVTITVSIKVASSSCSGEMCAELVTPGVPPGTIDVFGTIESRVCYDPYAGCAVDRSSEVVGEVLNHNYTVPLETPLHIAHAQDNQLRFDGISINGTNLYNLPAADGTAITNIGLLGTAPNQYGVACFIVHRDEADVISVTGNPACNESPYQLRIRVTGDNNANGAFDMPFDDTLVPLTGSQAGEEYRYQTSLWLDPMPGGAWQQLVWDPGTNSYSETYYSVLAGQAMWFGIHNPCRDPLAPAGCYEPRFGVWVDVMPFTGGAPLSSTNLVHYEDTDTGAGFWVTALTDGINTTTNAIIQGADTRASF